MAKKLKCDCCGESYTIEDSKDYFLRELTYTGHEAEFDDYFEEDMCGPCNYEQWWDQYERHLKDNPKAMEGFRDCWSWATDDD